MFNKILVALDRSDNAQEIFNNALDLAKINNSKLMLLHVLSSEEEGSPYMPPFSFWEYSPALSAQTWQFYQKEWDVFKTEGLKMLQSFGSQANTADVSTEFRQIVGSPGQVICKVAREWDADLILVGRRGLSGLTEFLLGSVSNYVLHHAHCSVLTINTSVTVEEPEVLQEANSAN
ncbi:MAG: universal stress protein [Nostocaceae cyanobacterium]|nr:universal stress protein [Nostocaceae cyanobacterium]